TTPWKRTFRWCPCAATPTVRPAPIRTVLPGWSTTTRPAPRPVSSPAPEPAIRIPPLIREAILRHAEMCRPNEACGLVAIDGEGRLVMAYPLTNAEASPVRF